MRRSIATLVAMLVVLAVPFVSAAQPKEGITVHGDWVVEVRNPDGSLAARHEFKNALVDGGRMVLANALNRGAVQIQSWALSVNEMSNFCQSGSTPTPCLLTQPGVTLGGVPSTSLTPTLTITPVTTNGPLATGVTLAGTFTAGNNGNITSVMSVAAICGGLMTGMPACPTMSSLFALPFTQRSLPSPIAVSAGQSVQLSVTFTFS